MATTGIATEDDDTGPEADHGSSPRADVGGTGSRAPSVLTGWLLFAVLGLLSVVWSFSIGPMGSPDEPAHTIKAVAVADGQLTTNVTLRHGAAGFLTFTVPDTHVQVPKAYAGLWNHAQCWLGHPDVPAACAPEIGDDETRVDATTYVGTYQPTYYLLVGWPARVLSPAEAIPAMRIVSGIVCAALLAYGLLAALRMGRLVVAGAAIAITPMALFLAATINPSGVEIAAAFCLWLTLLELLSGDARPTWPLLVAIAGSGVLLASVRPLSPAYLATIVVAVALLAGRRARMRALARDARVRWLAGLVVAVAIASMIFVVANDSLNSFWTWGTGNADRSDIAWQAFRGTGRTLEEAIGVLLWIGPGQLKLPRALIDGWLLAGIALSALALVVGRWRDRVLVAAIVAGCIALPVAAQSVSASGAGWQGRYSLPLLVGAPIAAGWVIDRSRRLSRTAAATVTSVVVGGVAAGWVVAHQRLMTREVVGLPHSLFAGLSGGVWDGPGSPTGIFVLVVAGTLALVAILLGPVWRAEASAEGATR